MTQSERHHLRPTTSTFDSLIDIALNLSSSRDRSTDQLWRSLDPELWEATQNPRLILQTVSEDKIDSVVAQPEIQELLKNLADQQNEEDRDELWFSRNHSNSPLTQAAYFSMEYMLSETLPIYSGGLGNVAGDQLKAADDLGVPIVGIGLLYAQGYFRQEIDAGGNQHELYPINNPGHLPIKPLRLPNGQWLRVKVELPGSSLWIRTWEARIGKTKLYLLDSNDPANLPSHRCITGELYGGGPELRLKQELVLGIGGWRLLRAIGLSPEVCHLNEGHAAFAVLERARSYMIDQKTDFVDALTITRAGNLFTTHTAVEAGFDRFPSALIRTYLTSYAENDLGISIDELLALGRHDAANDDEPFNMAFLSVHSSGAVNGVSELHGKVSRSIFQPLFPNWPQAEVPIGYVTNGVHMPTWVSEKASELWTGCCGKGCWTKEEHIHECDIRTLTDSQIWTLRTEARKHLIDITRKRYERQVAESGASPVEIDAAGRIFDANTLTLGFARRFATYKRPNLLLHDPDRLRRILCNHDRPVQLILAGKAHPQDRAGHDLIKQWSDYIKYGDVKGSVVFLSDYDMRLAQQLAPGIDLWINTPRRPWEASGTSGMKILANGGLNLSELDGWWAEAYTDDVGWALGDRNEHGDDPEWDAAEANALYSLLEQSIVSDFYDRDASGIPTRWVARIRESMARLAPEYSAARTVSQYADKYYVPGAAAYKKRSSDEGVLASDILSWRQTLADHWPKVRFGSVSIEESDTGASFSVQVYLGEMSPEMVKVEAFADASPNDGIERIELVKSQDLIGSDGGYIYSGSLPPNRPSSDFTARIVPYLDGAMTPLESTQILWQR